MSICTSSTMLLNPSSLNPSPLFNSKRLINLSNTRTLSSFPISFSVEPRFRSNRNHRLLVSKLQPDPDAEVDNFGVKAALSILHFYKREISPLLPRSCRYVPTCSEYSMIAYKKYGFVKGTLLTTCRICRCNPLGGSGFDPPRWFGEEKASEDAPEEVDL